MSLYKKAGVDIAMGDLCSALAYTSAKKTFASRKGRMGQPVNIEGGFTGALDFGNFYLVFNSDGVGSKMLVGNMCGIYDTLGYDLLAMVADDAICVGAETVAITNTIDTNKVSEKMVGPLMKGLEKACKEQKVVIPGGEIGEMPDMVKTTLWNSSAIGIVEKNKMIMGKNIQPGDTIVGLKSRGFRSNGFALVRHVLQKKFGAGWWKKKFDVSASSGNKSLKNKTWGEMILTPSLIYSGALLELLGRFGEPRTCDIKGIAHITGGGIPGNIPRCLNGFGASLDNLFEPHEMMLKLQEFGRVTDEEAYEVWNMGLGMAVVTNEADQLISHMKTHAIQARVIGKVIKEPIVEFISKGFFKNGKKIVERIS